eukprot:CAMPEP_0174701202 /NCGR_PEP_ID=MMETSP1094-20130205/5917_1 /TAXON_ID=156173 /ORGANISM="Chrysochromulina brevifilum, Strain UTEX LB 985" /LENGTH=30 /DNA_ID= /DNA_START= /DNA_END= /DNA_ORIENTATION=
MGGAIGDEPDAAILDGDKQQQEEHRVNVVV